MPMSIFSVVVFPAPLGPRKPKISPSSTLRCNGFNAHFGFSAPETYAVGFFETENIDCGHGGIILTAPFLVNKKIICKICAEARARTR